MQKLNSTNICSLLSDFDFDPRFISQKELFYLAGGWYEEYVYQKILNTYDIEQKNIALNVQIKTGNDLNELDVIFVDNKNILRIIECKSFVEGNAGKDVLYNALSKLQSIVKTKFGLSVEAYIYTKTPVNEIRDSALKKAKEYKITIKDI